MKKVLLASTALAFSAGWAMADVTNAGDGVGASITLTGEAKIGVVGDDVDVDDHRSIPGLPDLQYRDAAARFFTDIDLKFTMRGMTDGGLEFGAEIDIDENNAFAGETQGGETLWLRGAFGNLTMGDTDGAFDWAMQESVIGGAIGDYNEHAGYSGNAGLDGLIYDGQIARYDYTFGDSGFSVAVSAEIDDFDEGDPILSIGAKYAFAGDGFDATIGAGIQSVGDIGRRPLLGNESAGLTIWGLSGNVSFGGFQVIADYSQIDYSGDAFDNTNIDSGSHWGIALGYEMDAWLFAFNYGVAEDFIERDTDIDNNNYLFGDSEGYALTVNYDLGGGAVVQGAISHNERDVLEQAGLDTNYIRYSFGVSMKF